MKNDEHQLWRDERDAAERERDRHREPAHTVRRLPSVKPLAERLSSIRLSCPQCNGPIWTTTDSDRDRLTCASCSAEVSTRLDIDGSVSLVLVDGGAP